jgi:23S rRNA pseudouridine1911/1915/1917 synthase
MSRINHQDNLCAYIPSEMAGRRLDQALSELFPQYSRSRLQQWIKEGHVLVDGAVLRARDKVWGNEQVQVTVVVEEEVEARPENIPLQIVYQDDAIVVINKPVGMVVHPAAGNRDGTLLNALLHHFPKAVNVPRAGIVHRLDKDTSGLLVIARSLAAHTALVEQLQARKVEREYDAIVIGVMVAGGTIDAPIGRHSVDRKRMAVVPGGKEAVTHYRVVERFRGHTYIKAYLETGRTHQIRVHMSSIHHPLVGDTVYGGRLRIPAGSSPELRAMLKNFRRQALHAARLKLIHPITQELMQWTASWPEDMQALLTVLREDCSEID